MIYVDETNNYGAEPGKYMDIQEFADAHQLNVNTIRSWIKRGKLKSYFKIGNLLFIKEGSEVILCQKGKKNCASKELVRLSFF